MFQRGIICTGVVIALLVWSGLVQDASAQNPRPSALNIQFHRAETAWRSGTSVLEAKTRVDRVLRELPNDQAALKLRAQILMSMNRPSDALADARRAVELSPNDGEAHLILAEAALLNGDRALAGKEVEAAAERLLENAGHHLRLSWIALRLGNLDEAEAFARIALALDGRQPAAYYQLAQIFVLQERPDDAVAILLRGFEASVIDPNAVRRDSTLSRLVTHPSLSPYFK